MLNNENGVQFCEKFVFMFKSNLSLVESQLQDCLFMNDSSSIYIIFEVGVSYTLLTWAS